MTRPLTLAEEGSDRKPKKENPKGKETLTNRGQSKQDSESDNSYNWEDMENNLTLDIIDIAYYTAQVQYRLAGLDLHLTRMQMLDWITSQKSGKPRLSWDWPRGEEPGLTAFVQDLLDTTFDLEINGKMSIVQQILQQQEKQNKDLRQRSRLLQITKRLPEQQSYKVTSYKAGLLMKAKSVQRLIYNKNPDIDVKIHKATYQSFCNNNQYLIYIIEKYDYNYWPNAWHTPDQTGCSKEEEPIYVYYSNYNTISNSKVQKYICSKEHRAVVQHMCYFGQCLWHVEAKQVAGYWLQEIDDSTSKESNKE